MKYDPWEYDDYKIQRCDHCGLMTDNGLLCRRCQAWFDNHRKPQFTTGEDFPGEYRDDEILRMLGQKDMKPAQSAIGEEQLYNDDESYFWSDAE